MTPTLAVFLFSIATLVLLGAVAVALQALRNERQIRARLVVAERDLQAKDAAIAQMSLAHDDELRAREHEAALAERAAEDHTTAQVEAAREATRAQVAADARSATSNAVRAFGTTVVSLGADVGQVVSNALRENRNDEVYATLTRIDHTVQQMIRQAQAYVIVSGGLPGRRWPQQTVGDVVGGATGRVRDYLRVRTGNCELVVMSRAVEPLVHTVATLLDNALRYSPPSSFVDISYQQGHHGVTVIIDDAGVRMSREQMEEARQVLSGERVVDINALGPSPRVGFPGVAALARRYGFAAYVDGPNIYGGTRAMVFVPAALLVAATEVHRPKHAEAPEPVAPQPVSEITRQAPEPEVAEYDRTTGGLPKRTRRTVAPVDERAGTAETLARPELAAAWHSGSRHGRAAAARSTKGHDS
ncbi:sensor histidine kinase [Nocardia sp. NPDC058518]|uniref:sensor histidine kinase n=1 Tax=Nocardia sp. NPDC058518 TaxID=3346534 RepID=UPI00365A00CA